MHPPDDNNNNNNMTLLPPLCLRPGRKSRCCHPQCRGGMVKKGSRAVHTVTGADLTGIMLLLLLLT